MCSFLAAVVLCLPIGQGCILFSVLIGSDSWAKLCMSHVIFVVVGPSELLSHPPLPLFTLGVLGLGLARFNENQRILDQNKFC